MLKVLQLIPTLDRSGAEKQMAILARRLPRDRFQSEVAALTRLGPLEAELRESGVPVTLIGKRHKVDPFAYARLVQFLKQRRFDVVQTWIFAANVYGRLAAHRAKVPVVVTAEMAVDLWKGRGQLAIDRRLAAWTDAVVGNSNAVVDFYRTRAGVPADRLRMIYSGIEAVEPPDIDPDEVRRSVGVDPQAPLFLFAGRLAAQKGVDDLLKVLDLVRHIRPTARTLIVGDGPLRDRLEEMATGLDLLSGRVVQFLGHRDDVPRLLAASTALVLPSRYEGLPNVVLEAMRFRKPVVATAAPGTTETIIDGETGLLVPVDNPPALAEALRKIIDEPDQARLLGEAGRARVEREFDAQLMIDRFASLYEELAARARSRGARG